MRLTFLFYVLATGFLCAQSSLFDSVYRAPDTVVLTLTTPWKSLLRAKEDKEYQSLDLYVGDKVFPGRIRTRGNARLRACRYPSLLIKIKKDALEEQGLARRNDLKLVVQCNDSRSGESYLHRERLLYRLYQEISAYHHRTVPVLVATSTGDTLHAFLIETEEELRHRYAGSIVEGASVSTRGLDRDAYADLALFNYMILNTDWNIFNLHNVECLKVEERSLPVPIPYDFDYSGLVNTHYAQPQEGLGLASVRQPAYLGRNLEAEHLQLAGERFLAKSERILGILQAERTIDARHKAYMRNRLESFFQELREVETYQRLAAE